MNDIKLDDFKIGEVYGFIISNDQGESEEIKGCVTGHNHMQLEDAQADLIIIRNILNKSPIYILLDSIKSYYHLNRDNEEYIDAEVFNPALDEYNIERGTSVKDIISLMINNWEYYNPDMRKDLVCKFSHAVTTDVLIDLKNPLKNILNLEIRLNPLYQKDTTKSLMRSFLMSADSGGDCYGYI